jgi:hypothetical protein
MVIRILPFKKANISIAGLYSIRSDITVRASFGPTWLHGTDGIHRRCDDIGMCRFNSAFAHA